MGKPLMNWYFWSKIVAQMAYTFVTATSFILKSWFFLFCLSMFSYGSDCLNWFPYERRKNVRQWDADMWIEIWVFHVVFNCTQSFCHQLYTPFIQRTWKLNWFQIKLNFSKSTYYTFQIISLKKCLGGCFQTKCLQSNNLSHSSYFCVIYTMPVFFKTVSFSRRYNC